ncbi:peroxisomal biogenesis factor [Cytidiella melzeri]|nr:peroxisomal biogenesis factor [Cytidiella melzeri]
MATIAQQVVFHPTVSQSLKVWSTTLGRDKARLRSLTHDFSFTHTVQYFARFLAWFLLARGKKVDAARWNALKNHLALGRKLMRLGKPMEHLQAALKAASGSGHAAEQLTTIGRQLGYFGYLAHDAVVWANAVKFYNLKPSTATRVNKLANQFWLAGILFSISFGLLKSGRLSSEIKDLQSSSTWSEKSLQTDSASKVHSLQLATADIRYQFIIDLLDVWIPATNLGYVNLNDGVLGIFGLISSLMALRTQWIAVNGRK